MLLEVFVVVQIFAITCRQGMIVCRWPFDYLRPDGPTNGRTFSTTSVKFAVPKSLLFICALFEE